MAAREVWGSLGSGYSAAKDKIRNANYGKYAKGIGSVFSFVSNHVKNIALLDPEGFGVHRPLRVPFMTTQVVDHRQYCEFLPRSCFNKDMRIEKGELIVKGLAFPVMPVEDAGVERAVTYDNKQLYAINTNHQKDALKVLGLDAKQYKNKRIVIACDGSKVLCSPAGSDRRLMRAVYNAEVPTETRRIRNEATGGTMWPLTLLVALPFNLCAGLINVAFMIPHGLLHGASRLLNAAATRLEEKAHNLSVINSRGTVVGASSHIPYLMVSSVIRFAERLFSGASCVVGGVRASLTCAVRSVPMFVNSAYNGSMAQFKIGVGYIASTASSIAEVTSKFKSDTVACTKFYGNVSGHRESDELSANKSSSHSVSTRSQGQDESVAQGGKHLKKGVVDLSNAKDASDGVVVPETISLSKNDLLQVRNTGQDLAYVGVTVGYGTSEQVSQNFVNSIVGVSSVAMQR